MLSNGIGQLLDADVGDVNFRHDLKKLGIKGYEWVGWKNDSLNMKPITIIFKFENVRNFTEVRIRFALFPFCFDFSLFFYTLLYF